MVARNDLSVMRIAPLWAYPLSDGTAGSNRVTKHAKVGTCKNGIIVLAVKVPSSSDIANIDFWTSRRSDFMTAGTAGATVVSDGQRKLEISSDSQCTHFYMSKHGNMKPGPGSGSAVAISSNTVTKISDSGTYVFAVNDLAEYVCMQADMDGAGTLAAVTFIGWDAMQAPFVANAPYAKNRAAYTDSSL